MLIFQRCLQICHFVLQVISNEPVALLEEVLVEVACVPLEPGVSGGLSSFGTEGNPLEAGHREVSGELSWSVLTLAWERGAVSAMEGFSGL